MRTIVTTEQRSTSGILALSHLRFARLYLTPRLETLDNIKYLTLLRHSIPYALWEKLQEDDKVDLSYNILQELHIPTSTHMKVQSLKLHDNLISEFPKLQGTSALVSREFESGNHYLTNISRQALTCRTTISPHFLWASYQTSQISKG